MARAKHETLDITLSSQILDEASLHALSGLSERVLEHGALSGADDLEIGICRDALEALASRGGDVVDRLRIWLGSDVPARLRRARQLQDVLSSRGGISLSSHPERAHTLMLALQRLGLLLGRLATSDRGAGAGEHAAVIMSLHRQLSEARAAGKRAALLLVRCDAVNRLDASQGLGAGDRMRDAVARTIRENVLRSRDMIEPAGRSEFACVICPIASEGTALLAAQKILRVLDRPTQVGEQSLVPTGVVGIALFPEHGDSAEQLVPRARAALHDAHEQPDRWALYRPELQEARIDTLRYETRLRRAIRQNRLAVAYQPQANLRSGRIVGAEALLRWTDDELGVVPPNIAVAAAEASGLIHELTLWVITAAVQQCAAFRKIDPQFTVSINVSPSDLADRELPDYVDRALRTWDVPGSNVMLEITETAIVRDQKAAITALNQIKRGGLGVSIDDFGTGYSSMYYLAQMPLDELKIDLMFIRGMLQQPQHAKIVRSLIELAHNLELEVVAEGVESDEIRSALAHLRCDRVQGYYIGKPVPAAELAARLRA